jgi:hypothetical protein
MKNMMPPIKKTVIPIINEHFIDAMIFSPIKMIPNPIKNIPRGIIAVLELSTFFLRRP